MIKKLFFISVILCCLGIIIAQTKSANAATKPNFLVIMVDDLDEPTFDQLLDKNMLPNIKNLLIEQGVRFENSFVTNSQCCPSRASYVTGQYPHNTGVENVVGENGGWYSFEANGNVGNNLFSWLGEDGSLGLNYYVGYVGKFLVGSPNNGSPQDIDYWAHVTGYDARPRQYTLYKNVTGQSSTNWPNMYQTKLINDESFAFIDEFKSTSTGQDNFFLTVAPLAVHTDFNGWVQPSCNGNNYSSIMRDLSSDIENISTNDVNNATLISFDVSRDFNPPKGILQQYDEKKQLIVLQFQGDNYARAFQRGVYNQWNWEEVGGGTSTPGLLVTENIYGVYSEIVSVNRFLYPSRTNNDMGIVTQIVRKIPGTDNYALFKRTKNWSENGGSWSYTLDVYTNQNTGVWQDQPDQGYTNIVSFSTFVLPNGGRKQEIVRSNSSGAHRFYYRYEEMGQSGWAFTDWLPYAHEWDFNQAGEDYSPIISFQSYTHNLDRGIVRKILIKGEPGAYRQYNLDHYSFHATTAQINNGVVDPVSPGVSTYCSESASTSVPSNVPRYPSNMRVYADGNWENHAPTQSLQPIQGTVNPLPTGVLPAGYLRNPSQDGMDGFSPKSGYELPGEGSNPLTPAKSSFNQEVASCFDPALNSNGQNTPWYCVYFGDLNDQTLYSVSQKDFLQRLQLDRQEAMISVDVMVGNLVNKLNSEGLLENTVIIFTSDNGYMLGEHQVTAKIVPFEEAVRVPLIIRPEQQNNQPFVSRSESLTALNIDYAPTMLWLAGKATWANDYQVIDGRSLHRFLQTPREVPNTWRTHFLIEHRYPRGTTQNPFNYRRTVHMLNDYNALRVIGANNLLYTEYTADPDVTNIPDRNYYELYNLGSDQYQENNTYPNSVINGYLSQFGTLKTCTGSSCRTGDH